MKYKNILLNLKNFVSKFMCKAFEKFKYEIIFVFV